MATTKVTFTLDNATLVKLRDTAQQLGKPKSAVVREAIGDYHARMGKLSETERQRLLDAFDEFVPRIPKRPLSEVREEIAAVRKARRTGGRKPAGGARR